MYIETFDAAVTRHIENILKSNTRPLVKYTYWYYIGDKLAVWALNPFINTYHR